MNRDKLSIVLGTILILMHGFSSGVWADLASNHTAGGPAANPPASGRDSVDDKLPRPYGELIKTLDDVRLDEKVQAHVVALGQSDATTKDLEFSDAQPMLRWAKNFAKYRKGLADCDNAQDKSAKHLGALLDKFVAELNHISIKTAPDWKVREKNLLAALYEIKRVLKAKNDKYKDTPEKENKDLALFSKSDVDLVDQLEKTVAKLFGPGHSLDEAAINAEIRREEDAVQAARVAATANPATPVPPPALDALIGPALRTGIEASNASRTALPPTDVKDLHKLGSDAIEALNLRDGRACKVPDFEESSPVSDTTTNRTPTPTPTPSRSVTPTATPTQAAQRPTLNPGPVTGGNPARPTDRPTETPTDNNGGGNNAGNNAGNVGGNNGGNIGNNGGNTGLNDTNNGNVNQTQPFDPTALQNQLAQQLQPFQDVLNALKDKQARDDAALQAELAALNRNNNGDDTAALLKALAGQQQQPTIVQPPPQPPQIQAPSVESPRDNTPPFQPQPVADQQQQPPFNPLSMLPQQQQSPQIPYYPETRSRFDDTGYIPPPIAPAVPVGNPMLDMMRMMAFSQLWQQNQQRGLPPNVNPLQQRIAGLGPRPVFSRPGGLPNAGGFATNVGAPGMAVMAPNARGPLPAALSIRGGQRAM